MDGYKLLNDGLYDQYGNYYELNKKYSINSDIKYGSNGFHYSIFPENTLRFTKDERPDEYIIAKIKSSGKIECGDDYSTNVLYDFYGMYVSSEITILGVCSRDEIFYQILLSNNVDRVRRYIQLVKLTKEEVNLIRKLYDDFTTNAYIDYYQFGDRYAFYKCDEFRHLLVNKKVSNN